MDVGILAQGARRRSQHRQAHRQRDDDAQPDTRTYNRPRAKRVIRRRNHEGINRGGCQHESGRRRQRNTLAQQRTEDRHRRTIAHRKKESSDESGQHGRHRVRRKHARDQGGGDEGLDEFCNEHAQEQEGNCLQGHAHGDRRCATNRQTRSGQVSLRGPHGNQRHQHKRADKRTPGARGAFRLHYTHPTTLVQEPQAPSSTRRTRRTRWRTAREAKRPQVCCVQTDAPPSGRAGVSSLHWFFATIRPAYAGYHRGASGRKRNAKAGHGLVPSSRTGREGPTQPQRSGRTR